MKKTISKSLLMTALITGMCIGGHRMCLQLMTCKNLPLTL